MGMKTRECRFVVVALVAIGCGGSDGDSLPHSNGQGPAPFDPGDPYDPDVDPAMLSAEITNALFPAPVGATWTYEAQTDEGVELDEISVDAETRAVWGATARVVRDTVYLDGEMVEDTWDWFAQDATGHVWYLGEETYEYENGMIVCDCGAWESGVDGALPGVIMLADPQVGDVYRQEYLAGEAEDVGEVVAIDEDVSVPAGSWSGCLKTRDRSAIDASLDEYKYYCPGVGTVLIEEGDVLVQLMEYSGL
jgi:hypothetical protein